VESAIYTGKGGMLTGVARIEQEFREQLESRQREQAILEKKQEIIRLRSTLQTEISTSEAQIEKATLELRALENEDEISEKARKRRKLIRNNSTSAGAGRLQDHSDEGSQAGQEVRS